LLMKEQSGDANLVGLKICFFAKKFVVLLNVSN
jgi:hypothetical protein